MKQKVWRIGALMLALSMVISMIPMSALAAVDFTARADDYYKVVSQKDWDLAPGVNEAEIVLNNTAGDHRQVAHVVEIDPHNEYTKVIPSYKGMVPEHGKYGVQMMTEQAAYAEANGYGNVVAAMNLSLSWYDSAYYNANPEYVNEPLGYMILDGVKYQNSQGPTGGAKTVLIINYDEKDGVTRPADIPKTQIRSTADPLTGWEESAIPANFDFLVKNGVNQFKKDHTSEGASRSFVGVKADGTIVMVMNDGRQAPYSTGFTNYEMAEFMLSLGCVHATNGDGGGSSAFLSERPGEELTLNCSPSDGTQRPTTHGILVISTAPADGQFAKADIKPVIDSKYYTPGSTVEFNAIGTDLVGTPAEIPADVDWQVKEADMGTVKDGVFVSNGKTGTATVQMVYGGKVVGENAIEIVIPETLKFKQKAITVPFDATVSIKLVAGINGGVHTVTIKPEDIVFTRDVESLGTIDGFNFTAVSREEAGDVTKSVITATMTFGDTVLTASAKLNLGQSSEILEGFEDTSIKHTYSNYGGKADFTLSYNDDPAHIHSGNSSLRVDIDCTAQKTGAGGYMQGALILSQEYVVENANSIGFWLKVPDDAYNTFIKIWYYPKAAGSNTFGGLLGKEAVETPGKIYYDMDEPGWVYVSVDVSAYDAVRMGKFLVDFGMKHNKADSTFYDVGTLSGKYTFFVDDVTVDYSEAAPDKEAPAFSWMTLVNGGLELAMQKRKPVTTTNNQLEVMAKVMEDETLENFSGIDPTSAKAYVDGVEVPVDYANGVMSISGVKVADGYHRVKFEICDEAGNVATIIRLVNVVTGKKYSTIKMVPKDPTLDRLLGGSVYWMNLNANMIETVKEVSMDIDLNSVNHWELDHMEVAEGFTAKYTIDEIYNTATITFTRTGDNTQTGEVTLASLPIRVEYFDTDIKAAGHTAQTFWTSYDFWQKDVAVDIDRGVITFVDGYTSDVANTFSSEEFAVESEFYTAGHNMDATYRKEHGTAHVHTAKAADVAPTCTKDGYTGRTYCDVCESVVEWGTKVPATGHTYAFVGGVLKCTCGELFNGVYTDGKTYVDGVVVANGWIGESYYVDGVKLVGLQLIDGKYYVFDENGICPNKYPHSGWYTDNKGDTRYLNAGIPMTGYQYIANVGQAYFDKDGIAFDGEVVISGETCIFDKGVFVTSTTADVLHAGIAGEDVLFILYADGTFILSGTGATYDYTTYSWKTRPWGRYGNEEGALAGKIKKVIVGKDITSIGVFTFMSCYNIGEVIFEEGSQLKEIKTQAFHYVTALRSVKLPETVTTLEFSAFGYCENLESVYMPEFIRSIQSTAFSNDTKVVLNVVKGSKAESFAQKYGVAYETRKPQYGPADPLPTDTVKVSGTCGENVTWTLYNSGKMVISGSGAMANYASYTKTPWKDYKNDVVSLKIGKDITEIGKYAFASFLSLTYVEFEEGSVLHTIRDNAFHYCHLLESVTLPDTVTLIGFSAFGYCAKLTNIYMPECAKTLYNDIFLQSNPNLVLNVVEDFTAHNYAVRNNLKFTTREAIAPNGEALPGETIIASGKAGDNATWTLYMSGKFIVDGTGALYDYSSHKRTPWFEVKGEARTIRIGKGITEIGKYALSAFYDVKRVVFEEGSQLRVLKDNAFHYCSALKEIVLPESLQEIHFSALGYCLAMESIYVPESVNCIYIMAFNGSNTDNLVLKVVDGSYTYRYANRNNIKVEVR